MRVPKTTATVPPFPSVGGAYLLNEKTGEWDLIEPAAPTIATTTDGPVLESETTPSKS